MENGWREAQKAWMTCASIHREYAEGKDPLFKKRQEDFIGKKDAARLYAQGRTQSAVPDYSAFLNAYSLLKHAAQHQVAVPWGLIMPQLEQHSRSLSAAPPVTGSAWQPIETAPKDGTVIDVWQIEHWSEFKDPKTGNRTGKGETIKARRVERVWWETNGIDFYKERTEGWTRLKGLLLADNTITHWMPIPSQPESGE